MVLRRLKDPVVAAVGQNKNGSFLPFHEVFNDDVASRFAEDILLQQFLQSVQGFARRSADHGPLSGSKAVGLDHQGKSMVHDMTLCFFILCALERHITGRRDPVLSEKIFGKDFASFQLGCILARAKDLKAVLFKKVDDAIHKGDFGADDCQVYLVLLRELIESVEIVGWNGDEFRETADTGVSRSAIDL